ncbi:lipoprotein NlpE [Riemerella anatipestifer]|nr:lipoprotein NlpE [Riemerella anatipestifer]
MISDYMDKEKFENTGTFTWDVTKKFITLTDGEDAEEQQVFYVSDEGLFLVSEVGSEDIKEDYHLIKSKSNTVSFLKPTSSELVYYGI